MGSGRMERCHHAEQRGRPTSAGTSDRDAGFRQRRQDGIPATATAGEGWRSMEGQRGQGVDSPADVEGPLRAHSAVEGGPGGFHQGGRGRGTMGAEELIKEEGGI